MSHLFSEYQLRSVKFRNRLFVSPMCQYSCVDGLANDWHLVHLGSRAVGGAGLVCVEASGVSAEGRISPGDMGIWSEKHADAFKPITRFIRDHGAVAAIQLAHAGRKASTSEPWKGGGHSLRKDEGAWPTIAPSAIPFGDYAVPMMMTREKIASVIEEFAQAARLSQKAGFQVVEVHSAHGYLLHEFLSPISNQRGDEYGGTLENRMRFPLEVARAVRAAWPQDLPVFTRISASDWTEGGWTIEDSVVFSRELKNLGIDLIDCSSGGNVPKAKIPVGPGYQVPFAEAVRREAKVPTGAVGLITDAHQAEKILATGQADVVFMAREFLRDPYFPLHAAHTLKADVPWPKQYERAKPN